MEKSFSSHIKNRNSSMLRINLKGVTTQHLLLRQGCFGSHWWPSLLCAFYKPVQVNCAIISRHLNMTGCLLIILSYSFPPASVYPRLPFFLYILFYLPIFIFSIHQSSYLSLSLNLFLFVSHLFHLFVLHFLPCNFFALSVSQTEKRKLQSIYKWVSSPASENSQFVAEHLPISILMPTVSLIYFQSGTIETFQI